MVWVIAALALVKGAADAGPPKGLSCLGKYYEGSPVRADGGWAWQLPDGGTVLWDDGRVKTDEELDASPDLQDVFEVPYVAGPIKPIEGAGDIREPGRARIEALFLATYGGSWREVQAKLTKVKFFGLRYPFHQRAAPALERVVAALEKKAEENPKLLPFLKPIGGTWHWRKIARSQNLSTHAWGIAIDLNVKRGYYWRWQRPKEPLKWQNKVPQDIVDAFEAQGFIWGGRWLHYDTMHFEYRPELLDPQCR